MQENFDIDLNDKTTRECIDDQMRRAWKNYKYKLHSYFKQIGGGKNIEMAKKKRYPDLKDDQQKDWEFLCDCWSTERFKVAEFLFFYVIQLSYIISDFCLLLLFRKERK